MRGLNQVPSPTGGEGSSGRLRRSWGALSRQGLPQPRRFVRSRLQRIGGLCRTEQHALDMLLQDG